MNRFFPIFYLLFFIFGYSNAQPGTVTLRGNTYYLAFSDEFTGARIDSTRWDFRRDSKNLSTQLAANSTLKNGVLNVALKKETVGGKNYTGGGLISEDTLHYGYYEATLKTPSGVGWHSGFWLMKQDGTGGTGVGKATLEIDILENESGNLNSFTCLHRKYNPVANLGIKVYNTAALNSAFIKVGCLYEADSITFYYNNLQVDKRYVGNLITGKVNIWLTCIGYTAPIDDSQLPSSFQVDYIRYYQKTPPVKNPITLGPVIDAIVKNGAQASTNFGSSPGLGSLNNGSGSISESLLRFDLSSVSYHIGSAKLRVYGAINGSTSGNALVNATGLNPNGTWTENGVNWNNKPAESGGKITSQIVSGTTQKYYEWDVTSYIIAQKEIAMKNLVNLKLSQDPGSNALADYLSKEAGSNPPQLVITPYELIPVILSNPKDTLVSVNNNGAFSVVAKGLKPLFYQWKKDGVAISGATSATLNLSNIQPTDTGYYTVEVGYGLGFGVAETNVAKLSVLLINQKPTPTISTPALGSTYAMGQSISYSGSGVDPETGPLLSPNLTWSVKYFRNGLEVSNVNLPAGFAGSYIIPNTIEANNNVFYRFVLVARDPQGARDTIFRDIQPRLRTLSLATSPSGFNVNLDGSVLSTPSSSTLIEGSVHTLDFPTPQSSNYFKYWSQGGTKSQNFTIPGSNPNLVAFLATGSPIIFNPSHDAAVNAGTNANTNYGSAATLIVKANADPNTVRESLIRFNLSTLVGAPLESKLRLYGSLSDNFNPSLIVEIREVGTTNVWNEGTVTWNTKPAVLPTVLATQTMAGTTKQYYEWDLSSFIISSVAAGKTTLEFSLSSPVPTASRVDINSKEAASFFPELVVVTSTSSTINITTQPTSQTICAGQPVTFLSAATASPSPSVQWQRSVDNGTNWTNIPGAINPGYTFSTSFGDNGNQYRARWFISGDTNSSNPAILTVNPDIAVPVITSPATYICPASSLVLTSSYPTGNVWSSGQLTSSISVSTAGSYSVTVTSNGCVKTSAPVVITLNTAIANNSISTTAPGCFGATPDITGSLPTGGNGTYNYQWESSTTSATAGFTSIQTAFSQSITADPILSPTWIRRIVVSGNCPGTFSNVLAIQADLPVLNNDISSSQTVCNNTSAAALTGSTPTGGTGVYAYLWESATSLAGPYANASGTNNLPNYSPGTMTVSRWYRRRITSGVCGVSYSDTIAITVNQLIGNNTISGIQTICTGNSPTTLIGSTPTGGNGSFNYIWESSTTSSSAGFTLIPGANSIDYSSGSLSQTTWFRRTVVSGPCANNVSSSIQVTIQNNIGNNIISSAQTRCAGVAPSSLNGTNPNGGNGSYSYVWESSTTDAFSGFAPIVPAATGSGYTPPALTTTTWYRRIVSSAPCAANISAAIQITVQQPIANNVVTPSTQTICTGTAPATFTGSLPTNGNGAYTYSWEVSSNNATSGFSSISSTNTQDYTSGVLSGNRWFRRVVVSAPCANNISTAVAVVINPVIGNNTISAAQTICTGLSPAPLTGTNPNGGGGAGTYSFQWESSTTSATAGFSPISLATSSGYSPDPLTQNTWFRRVVTSTLCAANVSPAILITIQNNIGNNIISSAQTRCAGVAPASLNGTTPTGGSGSYSYVWQSSTTDAFTGFAPIVPAATSSGYSPPALTTTTWYRRVVSSAPCAANISDAIQITVQQPIANNVVTPSTQTICTGTAPATFTGSLPTNGNGAYTYSWEVSSNNATSGFSAIGSTNTQDYTSGVLSGNRWFRRVVTSGPCANSTSTAVAVIINSTIGNNTISAAQTICSGSSPATLTGNNPNGGGGSGTYTYQWESSTTSALTGFSPISLATSAALAPGPLTQTTWFRRIVSSPPCLANTSLAVQITVNEPIANNDITGSQTICSGTTPALITGSLPTGGNGTSFSYSWEASNSLNGTYSSISVGTMDLSLPNQNTARWFRRRVTSGVCASTLSDTVFIAIIPSINNNTITLSQTICSGSTPAGFNGALATGGGGGISYFWESSTTSSSAGYTAIPGATGQTYDSGPLSNTTWFRRIVVSNSCPNNPSAPVTITVNQPITNNDASANQTICANTAPATLIGTVAAGGNGTSYAYLWEFSNSLPGTFSSAGATSVNYSPTVIVANRWYRRRVTSGACPVNYSDTIAVTVTPAIADNLAGSSDSICLGNASPILNGSLPTGGGGSYSYSWESSTTSASSGFSNIPGEISPTYSPGVIGSTTWYRRITNTALCANVSPSIQIIVDQPSTVSAGPAIPDVVQGGFTGALGGSFGGWATRGVWSAPDGVFFNNSGSTPGTATYQASINSAPTITLTLTVNAGGCGQISDSKILNVIPDPFGLTGVINKYAEVVAPSSLPVGSLKCTVGTGLGSQFAAGDRAMIIQMKGAGISLPASPTDITYGYITDIGTAGNHEYLDIDSVSGDIVFFKRCTKKQYSSWAFVQLVKIPKYTGNYNVKPSNSISAIRLTSKGMGYPPNSIITTGFTVTPVMGGAGLTLRALTDNLGQINEVQVVDAGAGYYKPPIITLPDPTVPPFDLPAYKAKALAVTGLTGMQWNGKRGGILALEVDGNLTMLDSIHMTGMGFAGGMFGDKGDISPTCSGPVEFATNFSNYTRAGQKGEGITNIPVSSLRGKGRYATGGGGGVEPEGGGGGGANWQDGGRGGKSSYIDSPTSLCASTVYPCDGDLARGGLGGGTNPSTPVGFKNVLRSTSYFYLPANCRIFLGGGGGGGHAFNATAGAQSNGSGGFGGGIVILKANALTSNNYEILAKGENGESTAGDGAGGGGGGGVVLLMVDTYPDLVKCRVNGGNGGNSVATICEAGIPGVTTDKKRYYGAGGGGGGGVAWFSQPDADVTGLAIGCNFGQSGQGSNEDINGGATKGGSSRSQSELIFIENEPYLASVFTVGGSSPKPTFNTLSAAATWLSFKGTDASEVTLLLTENTSSPSLYSRYSSPATFSRIFTPGCTFGDATLVIKPKSAINSVNLVNEMDDLAYLTLDGIPKVTFKDLKISGILDNIDTQVRTKNGCTLVLDNVDAAADFYSESTGVNDIIIKKVKNAGSMNIGDNQVLNITDSLTLIGDNIDSRNLTFGAGSILNLPAGTKLNLDGANWINNGATAFNIDPNAKLNLRGNFTGQTIGGTVPTNFDVLNISNTGGIAININTSVKNWLQTSNSIINHGTRTLTISERVVPGGGSFTGSGGGRVALTNAATPVEVQGRFYNLQINSPGHAFAVNPITIDQTLILTNGRLDMGSHLVTIESSLSSAAAFSNTSWVNGALKRKVTTGSSYYFPVGNLTTLENSLINFNSISGGLQYLTTSFTGNDPNTSPVASIVTPFLEGGSYFSTVVPNGYWSINPDMGSANYDVWLLPSFTSTFPQYSIFKRATGGNEWAITGSLSNPENTFTYIQSDGSVRRSGLTGFSDFALGGGEEALPLDFIDFRAFRKRNSVQLNWKMAECFKNGNFIIKRGVNASSLSKISDLKVDNSGCETSFQAADANNLMGSPRYYYQIEASAKDEKTIKSPVRSVNMATSDPEKPFLSIIPTENKKFRIMDESIENTGIRILSIEGKIIAENVSAKDQILDLNFVSKGVYLVELVNNGWNVRQKIVVGF